MISRSTQAREDVRHDAGRSHPVPLVSIIVPCHNEADVLSETYRRITAAADAEVGARYELIFIDDGSSDDSWAMIEALQQEDGRVVGIKLSRNHGQQLANTAGLSVSRGDTVLLIDADLQDPPELLGQMRAVMAETGADVVYGRRLSRKGETWFKKASSKAFYRLLALNRKTPFPPDVGDFRLISRRIADILETMPEEDRYLRGMISWLGFTQVAIDYERDERAAGETKYAIGGLISLARSGIMGFSMLPLRLAGQLAAFMLLVMLCVMIYSVVQWLSGETVPGWTSLVLIITLTSSIQLAILSIMGEYIGRIYMTSKARPLFIIDRIVGRD
ncbi:glycosyltransferase family 2 protein [Aquisalinus flavus]|uniref:glycosyltransferase family 2 protein n=1 Tax=Aquisalinus flavus TaxID=1526572 RepID=UPI00165F487D|nr:glycosyltransferase family 2 protein [Aquisalinus flavus]MBD0426241.1 glycosyltransferase family 2 protein [Aquisalinus flavus]